MSDLPITVDVFWRKGFVRNAVIGEPGCRVMAFRIPTLVVMLALAAAACGADTGERAGGDEDAQGTSPAITVPQIESTPTELVPSALQLLRHESFPDPLIDPDELISGGPPPDGIPPIDEPVLTRGQIRSSRSTAAVSPR